MMQPNTGDGRASLTMISTSQLLDDIECWQWIMAGYQIAPEDDPAGGSFAYFDWIIGEYETEIDRRKRAATASRAPSWPTAGESRVSVIDAIKQRLRLEDVIAYETGARFGKPIHGRLRCRCPFIDHRDTEPSFVVYPDQQSFFCFGCGNGGDLITFWVAFHQLSGVAAAVDQLRDMAGLAPKRTAPDSARAPTGRPPVRIE